MNNYNMLSSRLINKLNTKTNDDKNLVEEGFFSGLTDKFNKYLTSIGSIFSMFGGDDKISAKMRELEAKALENEEKRQKDLIAAQEEQLIAKLGADFEQRENQLNLENERKVNALNASKERLKKDADRWKNNKTQYSQEQLDAADRARDEEYNSLSGFEKSKAEQINDLTVLLTTDKNGKIRTLDEIQGLMEGTNNDPEAVEFRENFEKMKTMVGKNRNAIISAIDGTDVSEYTKKYIEPAQEAEHARDHLTNAEKELEKVKAKMDQVRQYNEDKEKHEAAERAKSDAKSKYSTIKDNKGFGSYTAENDDAGIFSTDEDGNVTVTGKIENVKAAIASNVESIYQKHLTGEEGNKTLNVAKFAAELESLGIPKNVIDKLKTDLDSSNFAEGDSITDAINGSLESTITNESFEDVKKAIKDKRQREVAEAKNNAERAAAAAEAAPAPSKPKVKVPKSDGTEEEVELDDSTLISYDPTTNAGKANLKELTDAVDTARNKVNQIEADAHVRQERRKEVVRQRSNAELSEIPDDIKDKVDSQTKGVEYGEIAGTGDNEGKVGIMVDNKFIPKPDINASTEEKKKYAEQLAVAKLEFKPDDVQKPAAVRKKDGKYQIKNDKGEWTEATEEQAIKQAIANKNYRQLSEHRTHREALANSLASIVTKDGKIDKAKFDKLSPEDKASIGYMLNNPEKIDEIFKSNGLMGSDALEKAKTAFKAIEEDSDAIADDIDFDQDVPDEDEYANDNNEYDSDEDEEVTDEHGNITTQKKKLSNPAKEWKRKKKKSGGMTKSYYRKRNGEWESISEKEYKAKMEAYKKARQKAQQQADLSSFHYVNLGNHLFESINKNDSKDYNKLSIYLNAILIN